MTTVWLVRHGAADGVEGRCYGRYDAPLSEEGARQAEHAANRLAGEPLSHVYSSPLARAVETAHIVAGHHGLTVEIIDDLAEMHFGDFEGLTYEEIEMRYPDVFQSWMDRPAETRFPNGETFDEMRQRVLKALQVVLDRHPNTAVAMVAHAGVARVLLGEALSIPHHQIFRLAQRHAAINRISYSDHGAMVELING